MLIESKEKYIPELSQLWKNVFGDEDGYIKLFFDTAYKTCRCFAHLENEKIVSALYLLDCSISLDSKLFDGYYLYAAATDENYRGRGLMKKLIEEAEDFMKEQKKAFIALVPASASLYDYYSKFGFVTSMKKYSGKVKATRSAEMKKINACEVWHEKQNASFDRFIWTEDNHRYALDCLAYYKTEFYKSDDGIVLTDGKTIKEAFAATAEKCRSLLNDIGAVAEGDVSVDCPFELFGFEKRNFGMIYTEDEIIKEKIRNKMIYMNLALD